MKSYLLAPGPTPVPPETLLEMAAPIVHHRTPVFEAVMAEVEEALRYLFQTQNDVLILASSGTGGMDGAVTNFLSPGDRVVVIRGGKFGERWGEICEAYGVRPHYIDVEWGQAVDPRAVAEVLEGDPSVRAVYVQASETSTCVAHPIRELAALTASRPETILVVDAITAIGVFDVPTDAWGLDVVVTGSQKALMLPPGLAFVSVSEKAWRLAESARLPRYYFDFRKERKALRKRTTAFTPAVSLVIGLRDTLARIRAEGLENLFARHDRLARATRAAARALGLGLLAPDSPSNAATAILVPPEVDGQKLVTHLATRYGITVAGGQDRLKGKIVRVAHLGYADLFDVVTAIAALEMALHDLGYPVPRGRGVQAAEEVLAEAS